jgi:hypothetical protein
MKFRYNWVRVKLACQRHFEANESYFLGDSIAKREFWLSFTDELYSLWFNQSRQSRQLVFPLVTIPLLFCVTDHAN